MEPDDSHLRCLWQAIRTRLDRELPVWRTRIDDCVEFGQVRALEQRQSGHRWSDAEVFEALVRAVLSNSTNWAVVLRAFHELPQKLNSFDPKWFGQRSCGDVEDIYTWFEQRKAGSPTLRNALCQLGVAARRLTEEKTQFKCLEDYLQDLQMRHREPEQVAVAIGGIGSNDKLPGLGIPLAAEFLKNAGFDLAKPDRHICRAVGSFGLVNFKNWKKRDGYGAPVASKREMVQVMHATKCLAATAGISTVFADNAIWLLCATSGAHLKNEELKKLA